MGYKPTVLVVDDTRSILMSFIMLSNNYRILVAQNGKEAISLFNKQIKIDALITDIQMPEMDGLELIEYLNLKFPKFKNIIIMSSNLELADRFSYHKVSKPFDMREIEYNLDLILKD